MDESKTVLLFSTLTGFNEPSAELELEWGISLNGKPLNGTQVGVK